MTSSNLTLTMADSPLLLKILSKHLFSSRSKSQNRIALPVATVLAILLAPVTAYADYLGLAPGRPASVKEHKDNSIDVGLELWNNYQLSAIQLNRKFQKKWIGSVHLGLYGEDDATGFSTGIGAMYSFTDDKEFKKKFRERFKELSRRWNLGIRASAALAAYQENKQSLNAGSANISLIGSTKNSPRDEKLLKWYAGVGLQLSSREQLRETGSIRTDTELNLALSGGFVYPFLIIGETVYGNQYGGEVYTGLSISNGTVLSVGLRYNFK